MRFCDRDFSDAEILHTRALIAEHPEWARTKVSRQVYEMLGWRKPDQGLKDMSCWVALLRVHRAGVIELPAPTRTLRKSRITITDATASPGQPAIANCHAHGSR